MNIASLLDVHARSHPDTPALVDGVTGRALSWEQVRVQVNRLCHWLADRGVRRDERVGILMDNSREFVQCYLAAMRYGAIPVPLNVRWAAADVEFVLRDSEATVLFSGPGFESTADTLLQAGAVGCVVSAGSSGDSLLAFDDVIAAGSDDFDGCPRQNSDIADITYTSGSTGKPKGVIHHHSYHLANGLSLADFCRFGNQDVGLALSPLFHQSGQMIWSIAQAMGGPLVVLPRWDLETFLAALRDHRVCYLHLITTILLDIVNSPEELTARYDTSSVRVTLSGGGTASPEQLRQYEERIGGVLCGGYGRTEGGFAWEPPDKNVRQLGRNGTPVINDAWIRIVDPESGEDTGVGESGDILLRGDGVSPGYWSRPELNAEVFTANGWMRTGDRGRWDEHGFLYFEGRADQMIKTGGENVYPAEVENALLEMPEIVEVAVVGVPDYRLSERVTALVVASDPALIPEHVEQWGRQNLAGFKRPRTVILVDELQRLGSQKIDYTWAKQFAAKHAGPANEAESSNADVAPM